MYDKKFLQSLYERMKDEHGDDPAADHMVRLENMIASLPAAAEFLTRTGVETSLKTAEGELKHEAFCDQLSEPAGLEGVIQHVAMHHTKRRPDGSEYVLYGSLARDVAKIIRDSGLTEFPAHELVSKR